MQVWINGRFVELHEASVSVFDAGFQHAVGLFETMLARNGRLFRPGVHVHRLAASATDLRLSERIHPRPLAEAAQQVVDRHGMSAARVRLTITGGNLDRLGSSGSGPQDPTIIIVAQPPTAYPETFFEAGVRAVLADGRVNPLDPLAGHKTLSYWSRIQALQQAGARGCGEAIWFTVSNHLASGSVSNVFLVKSQRLITPFARGEEEAGALPAPVLPGVTRGAIIEIADDLGVPVERRLPDVDDLLGADEVFLTNSSWGVLPVIAVEKESIALGEVGPVTRRFRRAWLDLVEEETARE